MDQVLECLRLLARGTDAPLSAEILADLNTEGGWVKLQQLPPVDPALYTCPETFYRDNVVVSFARKSPPLEEDLYHTAVKAFWDCERENKRTNDRLDRFIGAKGPFEAEDLELLEFIGLWKKECSFMLGRLPDELTPRFSKGSAIGASGRFTSIPHKIDSLPVIYPGSRCMTPFLERSAWGRIHQIDYREVAYNEFFSVPKDARKDRGCCKEASGSLSLQLALGQTIRERLLRWGIDLSEGQMLHRELARKASVNGKLATIDLSNASDLISYKVVKLILPEVWFDALDSLRAPRTLIDGQVVKLEKFSSMGNGYTFELETVLFASLIRAVARLTGVRTPTYVYGDDMIVTSDNVFIETLYAAFGMFGFRVNVEKSYTHGSFRESCGGDFFSGQAVRPFFLTKYPASPVDWFSLHNGLVRIGRPEWTRGAREYCLQQIPNKKRLYGPVCLGDIVLHTENEDLWFKKPDRNRWDGFWIKALVPWTKKEPLSKFHWRVAVSALLYGVPGCGVAPRGEPAGYNTKKVYVPYSALRD